MKNTRKTIPKEVRDRIKQKFEGHCAYCGCRPEKLQIDHLVPVARGSNTGFHHNAETNLMPACFSCNNYKVTHDLENFRTEISKQIERAREYSVNFRTAERFGFIKIQQPPVIYFYFELYNKVNKPICDSCGRKEIDYNKNPWAPEPTYCIACVPF